MREHTRASCGPAGEKPAPRSPTAAAVAAAPATTPRLPDSGASWARRCGAWVRVISVAGRSGAQEASDSIGWESKERRRMMQ